MRAINTITVTVALAVVAYATADELQHVARWLVGLVG